jgi:hypothetical protein
MKRYIFRRKVEKILKDSLVSISSPSTSVKIQNMGGEVCLWCKGKTLLGDVNKLLVFKIFLNLFYFICRYPKAGSHPLLFVSKYGTILNSLNNNFKFQQ